MIEIVFSVVGSSLFTYIAMKLNARRSHKCRWTYWRNTHRAVQHRTCKCGAIQRYDTDTGEVTIWRPDGINSGLLDSGKVQQIYDQLN